MRTADKKMNKQRGDAGERRRKSGSHSRGDNSFPIVAFGASAGGMEAMIQILEHLPAHTGMAFIYVQHLDPTHESALAAILSRSTRMPVLEVKDRMKVLPDHVYVAPPGKEISMRNGMLHSASSKRGGDHLVLVDAFFRSLATDMKNLRQCIGVILSGNASDGVSGMKAIKAEGGITIAQEPDSAKYASMPQSAIIADAADHVLSPVGIAREIPRIGRIALLSSGIAASRLQAFSGKDEEVLRKIYAVLHGKTSVDFARYKPATLKRRIARRMALHKFGEPKAYLSYLEKNASEVGALFRDILISVTNFFRDPETFEFLKKEIFPAIARDRRKDETVRMWVAGCSTGEEAYSLAISFAEFLEKEGLRIPVLIFGTDLNEASVEVARKGFYSKSIEADISPARLKRFFTETRGQYQVVQSIREMCVFAKQDLTSDPPFSNIDLITCRNVFIYLEPSIQKKVFPIFHYALKPSGFLMLGKSESIREFADLYLAKNKSHKIYAKRASAGRSYFANFPANAYSRQKQELFSSNEPGTRSGEKEKLDTSELELFRDIDRILLASPALPASVLVNDAMDVVQFRGDLAPYLKFPSGKATWNLLKMAGEDLMFELREAVLKAKKENRPVRRKNVELSRRGAPAVTIEAIPLSRRPGGERYVLVTFLAPFSPEEAGENYTGKNMQEGMEKRGEKKRASARVKQLQHEVALAKAHLSSVLKEQEATKEEFQSAHEEILSSNEELQSINEELETTKEELQSTNEELTTVNDELQLRNNELVLLNNDLTNVLNAAQVPIIILDTELRIRRFTPSAQKSLRIIPADVGRSIADIKLPIHFPDLRKLLLDVMDGMKPHQEEVQDEEGRWYSMWVRPYKTMDNRIDGAVITLLDINVAKHSRMEVQELLSFSQAVLRTMQVPLLVLDKDLRIKSANDSYYKKFHKTAGQTEGLTFFELAEEQWHLLGLRASLEDILARQKEFENFEIDHVFPGLGRRIFVMSGRRLGSPKHRDRELILLTLSDHTEIRLLAESRIREERSDTFISMASHELKTPVTTIRTLVQLLRRRFDASGDPELVEYFSRMDQQITLLTKLVIDLLDVSKIKTGKFLLEEEAFDLGALVREIAQNYKFLSRKHRIYIEGSVGMEIVADRERIGRVLINLINNALRYSPDADKVIIRLFRTKDEVIVSIQDFGIGIAKADQEHIFKRFFQLHRDSARGSGSGLGMGLYVASTIIERHGGRMWVESEKGAGSTFSFALPLKGKKSKGMKGAVDMPA